MTMMLQMVRYIRLKQMLKIVKMEQWLLVKAIQKAMRGQLPSISMLKIKKLMQTLEKEMQYSKLGVQ